MKIGILALQGDFYLHKIALQELNVESIYVKTLDDLFLCDSLIIPGGESTTISILLEKFSLTKPILDFSRNHTIFGTCAGSIIMSKNTNDKKIINLGLIDVDTSRNSWGSQIDSFSDYINIYNFNVDKCNATFIRAPKFINISDDCTILGKYNDEPVLIRNNKHLVSSFHPEIEPNLDIYKYYLNMINE